ncbi:hypothetical protein [Verrucomicrobium spinosum]|uniref:hypothetical protein n=1 Tax=Verrucomicrobium spinosum TaxID=2736 RepID=UPI0009461C64|nr:hypothetical protein [Verrucomicrobium spinosum]
MKPSYSTLVRSLYGALAALMIFPALPAQAEGPIDHLKKRRRQIHEKIGEIFFGLGRKIEDAADRVDGHMEPVPPPPGYRGAPPPYRDDPYWEEEDPNWELELRYEQRRQPRGPGLTYPDGVPYQILASAARPIVIGILSANGPPGMPTRLLPTTTAPLAATTVLPRTDVQMTPATARLPCLPRARLGMSPSPVSPPVRVR